MNQLNLMNYCITQNCDDLHGKSGFPRDKLNELHGNVFVEYCEVCNKEYVRNFCVDVDSTDVYNEPWYVQCPKCKWNHYTGRNCTVKKCKGKLRDTIVNFYDDLHDVVLGGGYIKAEEECKKADICLCLGSSLTVSPANTLPSFSKFQVVVTPQATDFDSKATFKLNTTCDTFFRLLFDEMDLELPK